MPSTTWALTADLVPAPQAPLAALYPTTGTPTVWDALAAGASAAARGLPDVITRNAVRGDLAGRYAGGAYVIYTGLTFSDGGGLTLNVAAGLAGIDGPVGLPTGGTIALGNNTTNYIWLSRGGTLNKRLASGGTPLAPPDTATSWVYLGAVTTSGGVQTGYDLSGVLYQYQGNQVERRTADVGKPTDTPPATISFRTKTPAGTWIWDGDRYIAIDASLGTSQSLAAGGTITLSEQQARADTIYLTGTLPSNTTVVVPNWPYKRWRFVNQVTHAGYTLTIKVSGQTGFTVTAGQTREAMCNGTDVVDAAATGAAAASGANADITSMTGLTGALRAPTGVLDANGNEVVLFGSVGSAVNEATVTNAATGNRPKVAATGGDTNIGLDLAGKGTGEVRLGQATSAGVRLVADQPLLDSNGNELAKFAAAGSAVNEVTLANAATAGRPKVSATGDDTNIALELAGKGTGKVRISSDLEYTGAKATLDQSAYPTADLVVDALTAGILAAILGTGTDPCTIDNANLIITEFNKLRDDVINIKQNLNATADNEQALGLLG